MKDAKRQEFARAVVETRVLEKQMIRLETFESLLEEQSAAQVEAALIAGGYEDVQPGSLSRTSFDALLRKARESFARQMLDITPDKAVLDVILLENDIFNIKALLMRRDTGVTFDGGPIHVPAERAERYELLAQGQAPGDDPFDRLFADAQDLYMQKGAKAVQEMLDKRYFQLLSAIAQNTGAPLCIAYARARADFYNLMCLLRLKRMAEVHTASITPEDVAKLYDRIFVPGGTVPADVVKGLQNATIQQLILMADGTPYREYLVEGLRAYSYGQELYPLEKKMDDYFTDLMRRDRYIALGPEPLLGYLHGRRIEILNFRLILTSIFLGAPKHIIAERLRESYA